MIINKRTLIEEITKDVNQDREDKLIRQTVLDVYKSLIEHLKAHIAAGDSVHLPGFGQFTAKLTKGRNFAHPNDRSKTTLVPDRYLPKFKPLKELKTLVKEQPVEE
jgi:nucleoid DNA-binding protein